MAEAAPVAETEMPDVTDDLWRAEELELRLVHGRALGRLTARVLLAADGRRAARDNCHPRPPVRLVEPEPAPAREATPGEAPVGGAGHGDPTGPLPAVAPRPAPLTALTLIRAARVAPAEDPTADEDSVWADFAAGLEDADRRLATLDAELEDSPARLGRLARRVLNR